jgi:hypothetical protein
MAATVDPAVPLVLLVDDVAEDLSEFYSMAREIIDNFSSDSSDNEIQNTASLISSIVHKDRHKFFGLVDLVHAKITNPIQWQWATGTAVKFYK